MIWSSASLAFPGEGAITHFFPLVLNSEVIELEAEPLAEPQKETSAVVPGSHPESDDLRCCPEFRADESPGSWALVVLLIVATLGALVGRLLILGAPDAARFTPANRATLDLWAGLIGVLCGYGLAAFVVTTRWSWQVLKIFRPGIPWRSAGGWFLASCFTLGAIWLVTGFIPAGIVNGRPVHLFFNQILGLTVAGGVASIPGLFGFLALRSLAHDKNQWKKQPLPTPHGCASASAPAPTSRNVWPVPDPVRGGYCWQAPACSGLLQGRGLPPGLPRANRFDLRGRLGDVVRPGESGGLYVCELLVSLPDSSAR
jgi:hypothetical protein